MTEGPSQGKKFDPSEGIHRYFGQRGFIEVSRVDGNLGPVQRGSFGLGLRHPQSTRPPHIAASISVIVRPHAQSKVQSVLVCTLDELDVRAGTANDVSVLLVKILWTYRQSGVKSVKLNDM